MKYSLGIDSAEDPRNEEDYDTWEYGTEPIPGDHTWTDSDKELDFENATSETG